MKNDDAQLIQRVLAGDDTAFSVLVRKYQKPVHALAWRKIGDFHIAEEITQDTFLKAYQKLSMLKEPQRFLSWLYVIATNHCKAWLRKKRLRTESLENTESVALEKATYSGYVISENEQTAIERQREVVKKLLAKLQESERTIITLRYFGEMSSAEIGEFLGISANTVRSRLRRAQERLKKEEPMIREALEHFQITPNLTENIMREISRLKSAAPSGGKPFAPWAIGVSTLAVVLLMLGIGNQHLSRFQKPYSFDATSEMTVEIIEAPVVLNLEAKPDIRTQIGNAAAPSKNDGVGQQPDEVLLAAAQAEGEDVPVPKQEWIQAGPILGSGVEGLFATSEGVLYTVHDAHIYRWENDRTGWEQVSDTDIRNYHDTLSKTRELTKTPIAEWNNTLYIVLRNLLFASKDDGKTWKLVYSWADKPGIPYKLVLTEQTFWAIFHKRVFRSEDKGETWKDVTDELPKGYISLVATQNTVFARSFTGLYRWNTASWERIELPVPEAIEVTRAAATKDRLYVKASLGPDFNDNAAREGQQRTWWIFRSTDLGNSWKDITPTNAWPVKGYPPSIELVAAGETLLVMGWGMVRSTDGGETWMPRQDPSTLPMKVSSFLSPVALNEHVFYVSAREGLYRSIDGGKSWDNVKLAQDKRRLYIDNLVVSKPNEKKQNMEPTLYGKAGSMIVKTTDEGKSWKTVQVEIPMTGPVREAPPWMMQITRSGGVIYAKSISHYPIGELRLYRVSENGNTLVPIQGVPTFDSRKLRDHLRKSQNLSVEALQEDFSGATQFFKLLLLLQTAPQLPLRQQDTFIQTGLQGPFAVSGDTFYMEYNLKLFRWEPGDTEWQDIEQEETSPSKSGNFQLAVSGDTVCVGKRDGHLVVSFDKGDNWSDLTPVLPSPIKAFKDIVFVGSTMYVATDVGITASDNGKPWRVITDSESTNLVMEQLAVDGNTLYGVNKTGIYRLENGIWNQILSEMPDNIISLAVDGDTLYIGTKNQGMLHFNLDK